MKTAQSADNNTQQNPRFEAMKNIYQRRLDEVTEEGKSLREVLASQNVEMANPDAEPIPDTKDSDTHSGLSSEHKVDIEADSFVPDSPVVEETDTVGDNQDRQAAEEDTGDEPQVTEDAPEDGGVQEPEKSPKVEEPTHNAPVYQKDDGEWYTKIKVNGAEEEIPYSKVQASAQKERASYQRFEKAALKEQELEAKEAEIAQREARLAALEVDKRTVATLQAEAPDTSATIDELYDALAYDDEETVKAKLAAALGQAQPQSAEEGRGRTSTQDDQPVDVRAEVRAELEAERQNNWEAARKAAVAQWEIDYEDVASDATLRQVANIRSAELAQEHPDWFMDDILKEAGEFARRYNNLKQPSATTDGPTVDVDSRTARKETAPAPIRTNSTAAPKQPVDDRPPSRSEVVDQLRRSRGQSAL